MSVYAASDLHGNLPEVPDDCDVLLLAGDICPDFGDWRAGTLDTSGTQQFAWLRGEFARWLRDVTGKGVQAVATWGNHDYVADPRHSAFALLIESELDLPWTVLVDAYANIRRSNGSYLRVWGTPWVPRLSRWAFYGDERTLRLRADAIPVGADVLMSHGPPLGHGDLVPYTEKYANKYGVGPEGVHAGDPTLNRALALSQPQVMICGHIHEARGVHECEDVPVYNVAAVDVVYDLHARPFVRLYEFD